MTDREQILHDIRDALGRTSPVPTPPPPLMRIPEVPVEERIEQFAAALGALNGKFHRAAGAEDARRYVEQVIAGREAVASNAPFLRECGIHALPGVTVASNKLSELRDACARCAVGITSAAWALADTGTVVMIASAEEPRLVSLLPPVHVAVLPVNKLLTGLDELLTLIPAPDRLSSSMVLITGPSRTADIEQILVRGVHGPGEIHVVLVAS
jgi:L-lactate dehydrogenase complex protein LldG